MKSPRSTTVQRRAAVADASNTNSRRATRNIPRQDLLMRLPRERVAGGGRHDLLHTDQLWAATCWGRVNGPGWTRPGGLLVPDSYTEVQLYRVDVEPREL